MRYRIEVWEFINKSCHYNLDMKEIYEVVSIWSRYIEDM